MPGTEDDLVAVATDPRRADANARALAAMLAVQATLVDVAPASEVLGLERGQFLHAGPPIGWDRAPGPLRGALMGGAALEGLVDDPEDAVALFESGTSVSLEPCHHRDAVGPMAGVVTPSMWMWVLEDAATGRRTAWATSAVGAPESIIAGSTSRRNISVPARLRLWASSPICSICVRIPVTSTCSAERTAACSRGPRTSPIHRRRVRTSGEYAP